MKLLENLQKSQNRWWKWSAVEVSSFWKKWDANLTDPENQQDRAQHVM